METFVNNEAAYLHWIADHPTGAVLNVPKSGTTQPMMLHMANCIFISSSARTNYTTTSYYKVCAADAAELIAWAATQPGILKPCSFCRHDR